jgi:hypothetical protein
MLLGHVMVDDQTLLLRVYNMYLRTKEIMIRGHRRFFFPFSFPSLLEDFYSLFLLFWFDPSLFFAFCGPQMAIRFIPTLAIMCILPHAYYSTTTVQHNYSTPLFEQRVASVNYDMILVSCLPIVGQNHSISTFSQRVRREIPNCK